VKSYAFEIKARVEIGFSIARFHLSFTANKRESFFKNLLLNLGLHYGRLISRLSNLMTVFPNLNCILF